jgi:hypothetical protein
MSTAGILDPGIIPLLIVAVFAIVIGVGDICFPDYALRLHKQMWGDIGEGLAELIHNPKFVRVRGFLEVAFGVFLVVQAIRLG